MTPKVLALHPKVADSIPLLISEAKARGMNVALHCGLRTPEQQDALYAQGRTIKGNIVTNAQGFESYHCLGLAVDIVFKDDKGNWTWDDKCDWSGLGIVGKMFGFQWGGDWTKFPDFPHFQMIGHIANIKEAVKILYENGIESVWKLV